jgi:hypothetical protein
MMRSRIPYVLVVTVVSLVCQTSVDQGMAKVVRDSNGVVSNPGVEEGGYRLPVQPPPPIPYSFIGSFASEGNWIMQCGLWPWRQLGSMRWFHRHGPHRNGNPERIPPFLPVP